MHRKGWALLPLRLIIGFGFAAHGYGKLARDPENFAAILTALGVPQPQFMAWATTLLELLGGISIMAGAASGPTRLSLDRWRAATPSAFPTSSALRPDASRFRSRAASRSTRRPGSTEP
jgi:hypothetical protein